jgi:hypothetical protein
VIPVFALGKVPDVWKLRIGHSANGTATDSCLPTESRWVGQLLVSRLTGQMKTTFTISAYPR